MLAGPGASYLALSPDGKWIYCTHIYPNPGGFERQPKSEITVIDTARQRVVDRKLLNNVAGVFHVAVSPDGRLGVAAQLRPKNLIPLAHVEHGWVFGDSLTLFGADVGGTVQIPIDELDRYYALPWGVAITPDKSKIFLTTAGSESVTVIDISRLLKTLRARRQPFVNDLSASAEYVLARIPVGHNPRGVLLSPMENACMLRITSTTISQSSTQTTLRVLSTIDLGGPRTSMLFAAASASSTPLILPSRDSSVARTAISTPPRWLGMGSRTRRFRQGHRRQSFARESRGTEPFKWNGGNPDLPTECGPRTEKFFFRSQSFNQQQLTDW